MLFGRTSFHWARLFSAGAEFWLHGLAVTGRRTHFSKFHCLHFLAGPTTYMFTPGSQPANTAVCWSRHNVKADTVVAAGTWMVLKVRDIVSCFTG